MDYGIKLGRGTKITRGAAVFEEVGRDHTSCEVVRYRIQQTILLEYEALVVVAGLEHHFCSGCGAAPTFDAIAAEFVLYNNDGNRLHFPCEENIEPERDRYPVTGWTWRREAGGEFYCAECNTVIEEKIEAVKATRRAMRRKP